MNQISTYNRRSNDPFVNLVNGFLGRPGSGGFEAFEHEGDWVPAADVSSDSDGYTFKFDVPGVAKDAIDVNLEDNVLTVTGERVSEATQDDGTNVHRNERVYGRFTRSFKLPADADVASVSASYDNGVLQLRVAKQEATKPRKIDIN